jgi:hypothetical protein
MAGSPIQSTVRSPASQHLRAVVIDTIRGDPAYRHPRQTDAASSLMVQDGLHRAGCCRPADTLALVVCGQSEP